MRTFHDIRVAGPLALVLAACAAGVSACSHTANPSSNAPARNAPIVGPANGSVMVVGGGAQGPETFATFIELAGGPDALIVDVPTAGGDSIDLRTAGRLLREAGARNVVVYHTTSKAVADADSFVKKIANARGIWFDGGRHFRLVNSYAGTRSQKAFEDVLARGGVVGGTSAGASILASYLVRGAPSNDNRIMNHPQYLTGFGYLRNTAIDQHVVARERLADLHDSLTSRRPDLLAISEDEGTVWVVKGDMAEIIGRNKAFVYNGRDPNDAGKPFLTLHPGDRYNLGARKLVSRAIDATPLTQSFVDDLFKAYKDASKGGATVLVAQDGKVLINSAYGIPVQPHFQPETAVPNFPLGGLSAVLNATLAPSARMDAAGVRRITAIGGTQRLAYDTATKSWRGNVDDLYRFEQGRTNLRPGLRDTSTVVPGFSSLTVSPNASTPKRQAVYGMADGMQSAWVRYPERRVTILILTNDASADAKSMSDRIAQKLFSK